MKITLRLASAFLCIVAAFTVLPRQLRAQAVPQGVLSRESVLRDPAVPVSGNIKAEFAIVEYFDYQCPYCKKVRPILQQVVQEDGNIRLVLKDWPIFGEVSRIAARLALAAKYQGKYTTAHDVLMGANSRLSEETIKDLLARAGIEMQRAAADLQSHQQEIDAILQRNQLQAVAFGFAGTPAFIIGTFRVPGALDAAGFKQAIADARAAAATK